MKVIINFENFRTDLHQYMKNNKLSFRQFADLSGIDKTKLWRLVNGVQYPDEHTLNSIIQFTGQSINKYILNEGFIINLDESSIKYLSIEDIDSMIEKLKEIKNNKIIEELDRIQIEKAELDSREKYMKDVLDSDSHEKHTPL